MGVDTGAPVTGSNDNSNQAITDMNKLQIKGNWNEIKARLKQTFSQLTENDLNFIEGKENELLDRLQERLGRSKEELQREIERIQWRLTAVRSAAQDAMRTGRRSLGESTIPLILAALLLGGFLSVLLIYRRRREPTTGEMIREWLERKFEDLAKEWPRARKVASSLQDDLIRQSRNLGRRMHFGCR
jgi:uncharacterized protein YjbJ (UPF0337 family)